jgi:hypothetical protein
MACPRAASAGTASAELAAAPLDDGGQGENQARRIGEQCSEEFTRPD